MSDEAVRYTGIGPRKIDRSIFDIMMRIGSACAHMGYVLRSGAADGSDNAFECGASRFDGRTEIFLPYRYFKGRCSGQFVDELTNRREAEEIAKSVHPNWGACNDFARRCHTRSAYQVLGASLDKPSQFLVCWTPDGKDVGGTGNTMRIAKKYDVPIYNLFDPSDMDAMCEFANLVLWSG